ncbi:hypothetical protein IWX90DRAFT_412250 [Phyllosticta citrichinensis]|uniref:DUF6590 domain-containing protein n=1 Tax=Phyllosticta citrichinensis TaxID=1130410 RepID=A0ABR1Y3I0_9PEZI
MEAYSSRSDEQTDADRGNTRMDSSKRVRREDRKFKVLAILPEADPAQSMRLYLKVAERLSSVLERLGPDFKLWRSIKTYGDQGTARPDIRWKQDKHALVYTSRLPPRLLPGETKLKNAIQATPFDPSDSLRATARLDYSTEFLVPYDRPVRKIAQVTEDSLTTLLLDYISVENLEPSLSKDAKTTKIHYLDPKLSLQAGFDGSKTPLENPQASIVFGYSRSGSISSQSFAFPSASQVPKVHPEGPRPRSTLNNFDLPEFFGGETGTEYIQSIVDSGDIQTLTFLIENQPKTWKNSNFAWTEEMLEMGYRAEEVAELLVEKAHDSPWIYFQQQEDPTANIEKDWHMDSCPHADLTEAFDETEPSNDTEDFLRAPSVASSTESSDVMSVVHRSIWTDKSLLQEARLCCNSFTVLVLPGGTFVHMVRIPFFDLVNLRNAFSAMMMPHKTMEESEATENRLKRLNFSILRLLFGPSANVVSRLRIASTLEQCCLTVQMLAIGILSYTQAHITPLRPSFLDTDIQSFRLLGHQELSSHPKILAELIRLSCISDMLQGHMLVFRVAETEALTFRPHLSGFPDDILSTWGPGCYLTVPGREAKQELYAMRIKGGTIMASDGDESLFHWYPTICLQISDRRFRKGQQIIIGAGTGALTATKGNCPKVEEEMFDQCNEIFNHFGTRPSHLQLIEHQATVQIAPPQTNFTYGQVYRPVPATTIKEAELARIKPSYPFLESFWGLQVSFCTGVAKRVRMRELIADLLSAYVARAMPIPWWFEAEKTDIIEAFRDIDNNIHLKQWLEVNPQDRQDFLWSAIRGIIDLLKITGIDKDGSLAIAWVLPDPEREAQCLRIGCGHESYWAKVLTDSRYCATFAYLTSNCLETDQIKCTGPTPSWPLTTPVLSTAVSLHQTEKRAVPINRLEFQKDDLYFIGKSRLRLQVKVEKMSEDDIIRLVLLRTMPWTIPAEMSRRMRSKGPKRLREKTDGRAPAHPVLILAENHHFGLTHFSFTHASPSDVAVATVPAYPTRN